MLTLYPSKPADGSDCGASGIAWPLTWTRHGTLSCCFALTSRNVSSRQEYATNRFECGGARRLEGVLTAAVDGPLFPDWSSAALFGLERAEVWPELNEADDTVAIAINNSFNNLLGYPVPTTKELWPKFFSAKRSEVARILDKRKGRPRDCFKPRDYFDDLP